MKITIDDFKRLIVDDYKTIVRCQSRMAESNCDNNDVIRNCDLAQVVLSKFVGVSDIFVSPQINVAYNIAKGKPEQSIVDMTCSEVLKTANSMEAPHIMVYATANISFDFIYEVISQKLPLLYVVYNVESSGAVVTNGDILKMLGGFTSLYKDRVSVVSIKGSDYASLFGTLEKQIDYTRRYRCPSIAIIDKCDDSVRDFSNWIIEKGLADQDELNACCQRHIK